ncbi:MULTISPECIES: amidohydrolase family protein [Kordiimonas]|jgi:imidazolonepropionase-like amidohydrolase|uniref:amidohydrolase family protein n=1 Tax=Kordiimonas TaxID=288021 RepID=UPI00257D394C|nr:amidohydrolase family protein [Kordiimonas sp. UBA4487]
MSMIKSLMGASLVALMTAGVNAEDIAITGGTAFTDGGSGKVENATVLIHDGKIQSVTSGGDVPAGYRAVDASGKWVTVGFMVSGSNLGLQDVPLSGNLNDARASDHKNGMGLEVKYAFNPASTLIPITRIEGVTRAVTGFSASKDMWRGQSAVVALAGEDMIVADHVSLSIDMDESAARSNGGSRAALWDSVITTLEGARPNGDDDKDDDDKKDKKPKYDSGKIALERVMTGEVPLLVEVERKADILNVIELKKRFGINVVITAGAEAWMVADELAAAGIPVVMDPSRNLPEDFDTLGNTSAAAGRLHAAGVKVAFMAPDTHNSRLVVQNAGIAVAMGMPWEAAVDAISKNPAEIFGVASSYGTMEAGKDADVVVWNGDPLELMTSADAVFIRGEQVALESRQTKLRDRYKDLTRSPAYNK